MPSHNTSVNTTSKPARIPVMTGKRFEWLVQRLQDLRLEVGAQAVVLADISGHLLVESGSIEGIDATALVAIVSGGFAASLEIDQHLREERAFNLIYHEGARFDIYVANVDEHLLIGLVFDRRQGASRIGIVWLYAKRAIQDLQSAAPE